MNLAVTAKKPNPITTFFNSEQNFRFVFIGSLLFASLNILRFYFYVICGLSMIWGAYLFVSKMIYRRRVLRLRNRRLIYLFLCSCFISCFLHFQTNLAVNLYYVCWMGVCFFLFYGIHTGRSKNSCKKEILILFEFINFVTTLIMIAGLILLALFPKGFDISGDSFAIHENRFVGILFNANVTAFYAIMAFICCNIMWAIRHSSNKLTLKFKIYYIVCMLINVISVFLSDSNDSLLMFIVYFCFIAFYVIFKGYKRSIIGFIFRIIALVLACMVIAAVLLSARTMLQAGVSQLLSMSAPDAQISTGVTASPDGEVVIRPDDEPKTTFAHQNKNIDSGRFVIWKQSLGLFTEFPIMGIGKANIVDYGEKYVGGLKYTDFHNGLMTIIISYGLVGFFLFMVLAITVAKAMLKALFLYRKEVKTDGRVLMLVIAFCAAYCVYSMFEVALLVDISYRVVIFWLIIGLGMSYVSSYEYHAILTHDNVPDRCRSIRRAALKRKNQLV